MISKEKLPDGLINLMHSVVKDRAGEKAVQAIDRAKIVTEVRARMAEADEKERVTRKTLNTGLDVTKDFSNVFGKN